MQTLPIPETVGKQLPQPHPLYATAGTLVEAAESLIAFIEARACAAAKEQCLLIAADKAKAPVEESQELLTVEKTAAFLDVTPQTVFDWRKRGILQAYKLGNRVYFKRSEVVAALEAQSFPDGRRKYARRQFQQKAR
ncbi:helix-turn-helix domain-containing protein [Hymenobacter sp. 15J16-1T3B]|uniref:helix-turn-helix domain-containing protein n=1 Tax=Hymenobacter sp. 15J16-1T3B TaxID=2886941 RepID=UPI001D0FAE91|nr:helix-turn-helix domain-containing protein [Hymenobacter sp. 15J16-1T3B]MCC3158649.1 helix-turn-helix domain-containing protein [Hymenobacter sp. 15J16-1T3B]